MKQTRKNIYAEREEPQEKKTLEENPLQLGEKTNVTRKKKMTLKGANLPF